MRIHRRGKTSNRWVPALLVLLAMAGTVFGTPTNPTLTLTSDANGDGIAGVGDTITMSCRSSNVTAGDTPYVDAGTLGNSHFTLANVVSTYYSSIYGPLAKGSLDTTAFRPRFFDDTGFLDSSNGISVDVQPPNCPLGITIPSTYAHGPGGIYKKGDTLYFTLQFDDQDGIAGGGRLRVYADLTTIGLGTNVPLSGPTGVGVYTFSQALPAGRERTADTLSVLAVDDAGNRSTYAAAISYDTREPEIESVTAVNVSGNPIVKVGDQVKLTVVISNYDNDKVTASQSILFGTSKPVLTKKSGSVGTSATFEYQFTVTAGSNLEDTSWLQFQIFAKDDADNEVEAWSNALAYDTIAPGFQSAMVSIIDKNGGVKPSNVAVIDDMIRFSGDLQSLPTDVTLTVDVSGIGGVTNQIIPTSPATTTFGLDFKIFQGTSEDYTPRAFTITAKDNGGNIVYQITMPILYVDNLPPVLSSAQLTKISSGLATAKLNDTIAIQVNVANADGGEVWVDFQNIGGLASDTLSSSGGSTYRLEKTILAPVSGYSIIDSSRSFVIWAKDNAGNVVQMTSPSLSIDNDPPVFTLATYTVQPDLSSTHPYVRANDVLTFKATLAGSTITTPHDSETVTVNLTALGGSANQALTFDGGEYTYQMTVPAGTVNNTKSFSFTATDNAANTDGRNVGIPIDNYSPVVGPMTITTLTDVNKVGVMNVGDTYAFGVSVDDPDGGTCTIDLSMLGSSSVSVMTYDAALKRYYTTVNATGTSLEQSGYVFKALVTDKAGNTMSSLSSAATVDCVMPVIYSANATFQDLVGSSTCANIGDKVTITANIELTRLDNGTPKVNLTSIGGAAAQVLYDDGVHDDGGAGDGLFGYTQTVAAGTTNGAWTTFTVELTDDAGNRVQMAAPETVYVDNQPLTITSFIASQTFDNNGNTVVDLDGVYTTYPIISTDSVRLTVKVTGAANDLGTLTVDLTPLGIQNTEYQITPTVVTGGWTFTQVFMPIPGTTNRQSVNFAIKLTDRNGNEITTQSSPAIMIDNLPPTLIVYPISFVVDNGRLNEANEGDVLQIKVRVNNHDGILPMIDFANLYYDNGLTPPSPTLFPPTGGPNEYSYNWTVPAGLGTTASLTILAYDSSANMTYGYTNSVRFLSRVPTFKAYPSTRVELSQDRVPTGYPNRIANPPNGYNAPTGDELTFTAVLGTVYNTANSPAATVLVDIRSIVSSTDDDFDMAYADGDFNTYWYPLSYRSAISGGGNYVYSASYTVEAGSFDIPTASFTVRVLHPDVNSIVMASATMQCNPLSKFGIDNQIPTIQNQGLDILNENGDNIASGLVNIGDTLGVWAEVNNFPDYYSPASVTARIALAGSPNPFLSIPLTRVGTSQIWSANFSVATATMQNWPEIGGFIDATVIVNDDAANYAFRTQPSTFTVDNTPPVIDSAAITVNNTSPFASPDQPEVRYANVGDGYETSGDGIPGDRLIASVTMSPTAMGSLAWIDLSPIQGTSTYSLSSVDDTFNNIRYTTMPGYSIATAVMDLATLTFNIHVRDDAGNRAQTTADVAIDTTRPQLEEATYDGFLLSLRFSETIKLNPTTFDPTFIRIGKTGNLTQANTLGNNPSALNLTTDDLVSTMNDSNIIDIFVSSSTQAKIADWGSTTLYIAMGHLEDTVSGEAPEGTRDAFIGRDLAGNWIVPLPRASTTRITIPSTYTTRPKLVGGSCIINSETDATLALNFDKDMNLNTIDTTTLEQLAIWRNRSYNQEDYANRYRFRQAVSSETIDMDFSTSRVVTLKLTPETIDWLALQYTRTAGFINLAVNDPLPTNTNFNIPNTVPPLIRDQEGNRIQGIAPSVATMAVLTPLNSMFSINAVSLTSSGTQSLLKIDFNAATSRRARLYTDSFTSDANRVILPCTSPVSFQKIYLAKNANLTGGSFPLTSAYVDYTQFNGLNPQYASTAVTIPLNESALQTILSWGNRQLYIACEQGAFVDLWGNESASYKNADNTAKPITFDPTGTSAQPPRIFSVAMAPVVANHPSNTNIQLVKGPAAGGLTYEVAFETATISNNLRLPIDQSVTPKLELRDPANGLIDQATFIGWTTHQMDAVTRTVAQFQNSNAFASGALQRASCTVVVSNFRDLFELTGVTHTENATQVFDLSMKSTSADGFAGTASRTLVVDNQAPKLAQIDPNNVTLGITAAESASFTLIFDEAMNAEVGYLPSAYLKSGGSSIALKCTGAVDGPANRSFRFVNSQAISGIEGTFQFYVSSALDEAGNAYATTSTGTGTVTIRAKGPVLTKYEVRSSQETTGKSGVGLDYSPYATLNGQAGNLATISVFFSTGTAGDPYWLHLVQNGVTVASRSFTPTVTSDGLVGVVTWDGRQKTTDVLPIDGRYTYELRVYDNFFNEASIRGALVYDSKAPQMSQWKISHGGPTRTGDTMTFFNPQIHSYVKIDAIGATDGGAVYLRMMPLNSVVSTATQTYAMSPLSPSGKTLSFSGRTTDNSAFLLDGEYWLHLADAAGNVLGTPYTRLFIDTVGPNIASISMALSGGQTVTDRYNPRVDSLVISLTTDDVPDVSSGPAYIRIKQGSTVIRDLELPAPNGANYSVTWDGRKAPPSTEYVGEGQYQITVIDRAENQGVNGGVVYSIPLDVITSDFKFTAVKQTSPTTLLLTFSHDVDPARAETFNNGQYVLSTNPGVDPGVFPTSAGSNGKTVTLTFGSVFTHNTAYTMIVASATSLDGYQFPTPQSLTFTADGQGPQLSQVTFDGVANAQEFNVVFDEVVNATSATTLSNYTLTASGATVDLDPSRIFVRADNRSVRLKALSTAHIKEGILYSLTARNITDTIGNVVTTQSVEFEGRDVTPPAIRDNIFVFSNPANPLDITIVVQSNETLSEAPTAAVSQDGGTAQTIKLQGSSSNPKLYMGGVHLAKAGTASIKVTATDMSGNKAVETVSFATAYVNANVLASVSTPDKSFTAEFAPGSLKADSIVAVIPTPLSKQGATASVRGGIRPSFLACMPAADKQTVRFATVGGDASEELSPVQVGYTVTIPTDRLTGSYKVSMALPGGVLPAGSGLYKASDDGKWEAVVAVVKNGRIDASVSSAGTFALLRDTMAPRASLLTKVEEGTAFRSERPTFEWSIVEEGSGITDAGVKVFIDEVETSGRVTLDAGKASFTPLDRLMDGDHTIVLKAKDIAGNERVTPAIRFQVQPALQVFEIVQYPNPARSRATLRVATNRNDIDTDDLEVVIYDISGDRVAGEGELSVVKRFDGTRRVLDMAWDLRNRDGRTVGNGVYIAKIKLRDPDTGKTTKVTHKIAVLR